MLGKTEGKTRKEVTEDEMVGWHHRLKRNELEQTHRDREGQGNLASCSPRCHKESDLTEQLNNSHSIRQMKHGPSQSVHNFLKFYRNRDAGNCL